jgi:hypothetical protein
VPPKRLVGAAAGSAPNSEGAAAAGAPKAEPKVEAAGAPNEEAPKRPAIQCTQEGFQPGFRTSKRSMSFRSMGFNIQSVRSRGNKWIGKQRQLKAPFQDQIVRRGVKISS